MIRTAQRDELELRDQLAPIAAAAELAGVDLREDLVLKLLCDQLAAIAAAAELAGVRPMRGTSSSLARASPALAPAPSSWSSSERRAAPRRRFTRW
jgi:hypothetical protein